MSAAVWVALVGGAVVLLVAILLAGVAIGARRAQRAVRARESALAEETRTEIETLRARVEELSDRLERQTADAATTPGGTGAGGSGSGGTPYLITSAGRDDRDRTAEVPDRVVLSATVGEPLVKLAAFGYGLRRALAPETRNRIAFQMRREVRRARKERRRAARRTRVAEATRSEGSAA